MGAVEAPYSKVDDSCGQLAPVVGWKLDVALDVVGRCLGYRNGNLRHLICDLVEDVGAALAPRQHGKLGD